ncbi:MAG: hypothetical protein Kow0069_37590 [Promethearchaeota archaeon]
MGRVKFLKIVTLGDSLTQGSPPPCLHPDTYQYHMLAAMRERGVGVGPDVHVDVVNHGVGGQVAAQVVDRIPGALDPDVDAVVLMAGTNDAWRYTAYDEEMAADVRDDVVQTLVAGVKKCLELREVSAHRLEVVVLCAVPPVGAVPSIPKYMGSTIEAINERLATACTRLGVTFCDVHEAMRGEGGRARPDLVVGDGVHFTRKGYEACGRRIGACVASALTLGGRW